ncbi:MAG: polysaccharide pyruvyl transferase family protein [Lentisphaeria bacterium]|nr:polysaccharide pyruvyl transferase family protein [Lentisphaeria bacterium]
MKILLGGVPLGCDNIGDEAIIACVVKLLRGLFPSAELTVCTREREKTEHLLGVATAPLYGFPPEPDWHGFEAEVGRHDVYFWFGATGLSDYPENALRLLDTARLVGVKTIVWGVGMNSALNPAFYRAGGKKRKLLRLMTVCSLGLVDWVSAYENLLCRRTRDHIRRSLEQCALVVLRDAESVRELERCGFTRGITGADTAILLESAEPPLKPDPALTRVGFCISAQNAIRNLDGMKKLWNSLLSHPGIRLVLIPMNPKTDRELMRKLAAGIEHPDRIECLEDDSPATVQACAGQCRLVVSSRLHLLILAANAGVPGLGIERGSKISNWLNAFGRTSSGTVEDCDPESLERQILELAAQPEETLKADTAKVMMQLHERLDKAVVLLREALAGADRS